MRKCFGIAFLCYVIDGDTWIDRHFHKEIRKLQEGTLSQLNVRGSDVNITCGLRLQLLELRQRSLRQKTVFTRYVFDCDFTTPVSS